mgnify:CR=1 FL=1
MKVWIISVGEPLPTDGENTRLRRMGSLAKCMAEKGHIVEWFSASFDHYKKKQRCSEDKSIKISENYTMHLLHTNGYKKNVSLARIIQHKMVARKIYKKMNELDKPDVIIASMEPLEVAKIATKFGKEKDVPVVVDVRDLWPEIYYEVFPKKMHCLLTPYVQVCKSELKSIMTNAYSIIGLSDGFLDYGLRFAQRKRAKKDRVFPIGYPNYSYSEYKNELEKHWGEYGLTQNDFIIVFLGNFGKQFDFEAIIKASQSLKNIPEIKFVLCGTGPQFDYVRNNTADNVIMPGWIEKDQILSLSANARLGIAPYINSVNYIQNTPNKFGEYLSASSPILVSVPGIMENILMKEECGHRYINEIDLADYIKTYYKDEDKLKKASNNARKLYDKDFNGDKLYENMLQYLIEIKSLYNGEEI